MKNKIKITTLSLATILSLINCQNIPQTNFYERKTFYIPAYGKPEQIIERGVDEIEISKDLERELKKIKTLERLTSWVYYKISYSSYQGERWKPPQETLDRKEGDCEDFSLLEMKLAELFLNIKPNLVLLSYEVSPYYLHWIIEDKGRYFDPTQGKELFLKKDLWQIEKKLSYEEAFKKLDYYISEEKKIPYE